MTKGVRTTGGSLAYKDRVPDANAAYIDKIFDAGAVMLGKTNTPEFGHLGTSDNRLGPPCGNPWNPERTSGGSSGGAGSSLAAGLCALATGGDGGGSIRIPASFNGIFGIKPTQGRVSSYTEPTELQPRTSSASKALCRAPSPIQHAPRSHGGLRSARSLIYARPSP